MAVSPKDLGALTPEDEAAISKFENILDEKLAEHFVPGTKSTFNLTNVVSQANHRFTYKMRGELLARYEKAGWVVTVDHKGSDEFITFVAADTLPPPPVVPDIPLDQMAKGRPPEPGSRPPIVTPMTRENIDNPYRK